MKQAVEIFDGYGGRERLEKLINAWLQAAPREVLGIQATSLRLFVHWREGVVDTRGDTMFMKLFKTLPNGSDPAKQFASFFQEHPNAVVVHRAGNGSFLFWYWRDAD